MKIKIRELLRKNQNQHSSFFSSFQSSAQRQIFAIKANNKECKSRLSQKNILKTKKIKNIKKANVISKLN